MLRRFALGLLCGLDGLGLLRGEDWQLMLLTAISMAVAAVPEGLPAVVTIALAIFFLVVQPMNRLSALRAKEEAEEEPAPTEVDLLTEIRDELRLIGRALSAETHGRNRKPAKAG